MEPEQFFNPMSPTFNNTNKENWLKCQKETVNHPLFQLAIRNLPKVDYQALQAAVRKQGEEVPEEFIKRALTLNRWVNPICNQCFDKSTPANLFPCSECGLTFYCSSKCQTENRSKHSRRCCKLDGPLDDGPITIIFSITKIKE